MFERSSGILMHISSLPNRFGIGSVGKDAYEFVDFLKKSGQKYWQILPVGHTSYGDSPYQCFSAFAGNYNFIDFSILEDEGLLKEEDYVGLSFGQDNNKVDYKTIFITRELVLRKAFNRFEKNIPTDFNIFINENKFWLKDYSLYMAVKKHFNLETFHNWDGDIRLREESAVKRYEESLKEDIKYWNFIQYKFFEQWKKLKAYANKNGVYIIGDIPIYVASDSSDIWCNPEMFEVDENSIPTVVSGCPPDAFALTGQLWGNPIYDWAEMERQNYKWWILRIKESFKLYDVVRIDHFRGFESYWEVPGKDLTAENGRWVLGPGVKLFNAIKNELGDLNIIAEDLGYLTKEVIDFREATGYPGMKVLQFGFNGEGRGYLPHNYPVKSVAYTGTHDNDTFRGWAETTGRKEDLEDAIEYFKITEEEGYNWGFIRGIWSAVSYLAIAPMQDFLNLGNGSRMNLPSTIGGNWQWRVKESDLTDKLAEKICKLTKTYDRV
ncbi:4-alpha-glucanotransferase [Clostridium gasigenes]|uniref:4-alpha-glucanotransferase n=1 Tax=Clostridium gasigenes TaxID=94869 RepID=UPI001C0D9198|nr:4-alpha-glucanotransferase [Clostridium gasigenes]MBU3137442.1 4-alpha-glucanotransferase [Clostridium gasigenes]